MSEINSENKPSPEDIAFMELKGKIVNLMHEFIDKYCGRDNPNHLYPRTGYIMVDVLTECLTEAQYQVPGYQPFTSKQIDHICYQIREWYLSMKPLLEGQYNIAGSLSTLLNQLPNLGRADVYKELKDLHKAVGLYLHHKYMKEEDNK